MGSWRYFFFFFVILNLGTSFAQEPPSNTKPNAPLPTCFGEPMPNFELPQFGDAVDQGKEGTCFSYAAVAGVEAALYRQSGIKKPLSQEFATVNYCVQIQYSATMNGKEFNSRQKKIGVKEYEMQQANYLNFMDGGITLWAIKSLLDSQRAPWDLPTQRENTKKAYNDLKIKIAKISLESQAKAKLFEAEKLPELQQKIEENERQAMEYMRLMPKVSHLLNKQHFVENQKLFDHKALFKIENKLNKLREEAIALHAEMYTVAREIERIYDAGSREICDQAHCYIQKLKEGQSDMADLSALELIAEDISFARSMTLNQPKGECSFSQNRDAIEKVMRNLCIGLPVATGVSDTKIKVKIEDKKHWSSQQLGPHAMVIRGVKNIGGKAHFIFRNSWGALGSDIALDFDNACKLDFSGAVANRTVSKGETMSEATAWVHSTMEAPKGDKAIAAREFYKNRVGKFIKITQADSYIVEAPMENGIFTPMGPKPPMDHKSNRK